MPTEDENLAWKLVAKSQGLVCLVCGEPPALHRREEFYDSGLCRACAADIEAEHAERAVMDGRSGAPSLA